MNTNWRSTNKSSKFPRLFPIILQESVQLSKKDFKELTTVISKKAKLILIQNEIKQHISTLWKNTLNSRKQAFFQYYKAKNVAEIFTELLKENPPKMPWKFLPKAMPNENKEETPIRQQLSLEKFKAEIN